MGVFPKKNCVSSPYAVPNSAPNPQRFKLIRERQFAGCAGGDDLMLVVEVLYPDATNFEGRKIMVYENVRSFADLLRRTGNRLDPHFSQVSMAPIARFKPTERGWALACWFAENA